MNIDCDKSLNNRSVTSSPENDLSDTEDCGYYSSKLKELRERRNKLRNLKNTFENCIDDEVAIILKDNELEDTAKFLPTPKQSKHATNSRGRNGKQATKKRKAEKSPEILLSEDIPSTPLNKGRRGKKAISSDKILDDIDVSVEIIDKQTDVQKKPPKRSRKTKNTANDSSHQDIVDLTFESPLSNGVQTRANKRGSQSISTNTLISQDNIVSLINNTRRGRRRGGQSNANRGRRGRGQSTSNRGRGGRTSRQNQSSIITYNIGNTDEYPDLCEDVALFKNQTTTDNDLIITDDTDEIDNEMLSVKVFWQDMDVIKFNIRKYQKLKEIFETFAKRENVGFDKLLFRYKNKIIKCDDSPKSIEYSIADFINGDIAYDNINVLVNETKEIKAGIKIKFQCKDSKKPMSFYVEKNDKLSIVMIQCAEHLEVPLTKLKFVFDGERIAGSSTPEEIGIENGDCIDVIILS